MARSVSFIVLGEPASKANSRRIVRFGNRAASIKSQKALDYLAAFRQQCPVLPELMAGDVRVFIRVYYKSRRPDLDCSVILDAMQGLIYANDRQVKEQHFFHDLDRTNPRAEIRVEEIT